MKAIALRVVAATVLALAGHAASAAQWLAVPGLQVRTNLSGMRALRYTNMVAQEHDFSCGAAALATILDYGYGFHLSETQAIEGLMRRAGDPAEVLKNGFSMLDMKNYAESLGLRAVGFQVNMAAMDQLRIPVIVLLDIRGYSHFVVVKKVNEDLVFISDPALGNRSIDVADFRRDWHGLVLAIVGRPFIADSPLLRDNFSKAREIHDELLHESAPTLDYGMPKYGRF